MNDPRLVTRSEVGLELAQALVQAACTAAQDQGIAICVAVCDRSGGIIASARMDSAPLGSMQLAVDKAYTSAIWQMPTEDLRASTQPGGADWGLTSTAGGRIVVYAGGLPIHADGALVGSIGVSGGTGEQDLSCAAQALTSQHLITTSD